MIQDPDPTQKGWWSDLTPALGAYAQVRRSMLSRREPERVQEALLQKLVQRASRTRFGRGHRFDRIVSTREFARRVPVRDFADFWEEWWQPDFPNLIDLTWPGKVPLFSVTSGTTTGRSKYIPYTPQMRRAAAKGVFDLLSFHLQRRPESRVLGGALLGLVGPTSLRSVSDGVEAGAVSAITAGMAPGFLRDRLLPPPDVAEIKDWGEKIRQLAGLALRADVRAIGGSPNWLLLFFREVERQAPGASARLAEWFPDLDLIIHGGIDFAPYRRRFERLMAGGHAETREIYSASEGFFACADGGDGEGLRLLLDGGVFFEFIPLEDVGATTPRRDWIATARLATDYAVVVTTAAGLWAYLLGDIVRFVSLSPARIVVRGRLSSGLSTVGEHLIEAEIVDSVTAACGAIGLSLTDFAVSGVAMAGEEPARHTFWVECDAMPDTAAAASFDTVLDQTLKTENEDYRDYRHNDMALGPPRVHFVPPGAFARWLQGRRAAGGQNKVPRVIDDPALSANLKGFMADISDRMGTP